jgi:hypothetical protein
LNRLGEVAQTFILGFTLSIGTGRFETSRPETAFARLPMMNYRGQLFPKPNLKSARSDFEPIT